MVQKTYGIEPLHAGVVIGPKGAGLRALREIPNVYRVNFDTKSSTSLYRLIVSGASIQDCDSVHSEIKKRIIEKGKDRGTDTIYVDEKNPSLTKIILRPISCDNEVV